MALTPVTAFQNTQQSTASTSLVEAGCETAALASFKGTHWTK